MSPSEPPGAAGRGVRSVARALRILKAFGPERHKATLTDLARASNLAPSTTIRIVQTLEEEKFLSRLEDGSYTYGSALVRLGLAARESFQLVDVAGPHLSRLTHLTGETTNLGVPHIGDSVLYIDNRPSSHSLRAHSWLGRTVPQEGTAIGAAIQGRVNDFGWVIARTTLEPGVTALAAPIFDQNAAVVGAINITGPSERVLQRYEAFAVDLSREAAALTKEIGGTWPFAASDLDAAVAARGRNRGTATTREHERGQE